MDQETDFFGGVLRIALGIVLGGALLWFGVSRYEAYQLKKGLAEVSARWQLESEATRKAQRRREADAWAERELAAIKSQKERRSNLQAQRQANQQAAIAVKQQADQQRAKDLAWAKFYAQPERCRVPADFDVTVECGNAYMKAKQEFESNWLTGHR